MSETEKVAKWMGRMDLEAKIDEILAILQRIEERLKGAQTGGFASTDHGKKA